MTCLLSTFVAAAAMAAATRAPTPLVPSQPAPAVGVALSTIREVRELDLEANDPADEHEMFFMTGDDPSLLLEWRMTLPPGSKLVEVSKLRDLVARDSTGRDLAPDDLDMALTADPRYEFGDFAAEPQEVLDTVTLSLAVSDRKADAFSLSAVADATIATGVAELQAAMTNQWQTLAAESFGGEAVRIRLNRDMGEMIGVEFSPAHAAERAIESLRLNYEGDELDHSGSMSDHTTIIYFFDGTLEAGQAATLTMMVRTGLQTVPIRFELKDQALP